MAPPAGGVGTQVAAGTAQQQPAQQGLGQVLFGVVRMGLFWYFAMQMFGGSKKVTNPALLTNNLFSKGEDLVFFFPPFLSRLLSFWLDVSSVFLLLDVAVVIGCAVDTIVVAALAIILPQVCHLQYGAAQCDPLFAINSRRQIILY
jgi:hypothetical protein